MAKKHLWVSVDVEADHSCPGLGSMVSFGAVVVEPELNRTFYGETAPISDKWVLEALAVSGFTREQHLKFPKPEETMLKFVQWLKSLGADRLIFVSDNIIFDGMWCFYYLHTFAGENPFGFSGRRLGDIYSGLTKSAFTQNDWKKMYRKTVHDHNPKNDATANAEALLAFRDKLGFKF